MDQFTSHLCARWLEAQPDDLKDYLSKYAAIEVVTAEDFSLEIQLSFENADYTNVVRCQENRLVEVEGLRANLGRPVGQGKRPTQR